MDWKFLPVEGNLLDQPAWLMEDLAIIAWRKGCVEDMKSGGPTGNIPEQARIPKAEQ